MNNRNTKLILFAAVIFVTGSALYAGGPRHHHKPDGIDTAARIVDLVLSVVRPVETVVVTQTPVMTQTVYTTVPTTVVREVYTTPVVYTQTVYSAPPSPRPRYIQTVPQYRNRQAPRPGNNRPGQPGPRR